MMNLAAVVELLGLVLKMLDRHRDDPETAKALAIVAGLMAAVQAGDRPGAMIAMADLRTHVRANVIATDAAIDAELVRQFHKDPGK